MKWQIAKLGKSSLEDWSSFFAYVLGELITTLFLKTPTIQIIPNWNCWLFLTSISGNKQASYQEN